MEDQKLNKILDLIIAEYNPKTVILFGSRGKNTRSFNSDYDLAIDTAKVNYRIKRKVMNKIDDIIGLHKVNLVYLNEIDEEFRNIVFSTGKIIYER